METSATVRLDEIGRVLIPQEIRKRLDWDKGDVLSVDYVDSHTVHVKLFEKCPEPRCVICSAKEDIKIHLKDTAICGSCLKEIKDKA